MANNVYVTEEASVVFAPSGGDEPFTITSLASGAARVSDQYDFGASAHSEWFLVKLETKSGGTPVVGERLDLFCALANNGAAAETDGDVSQTDSALSSPGNVTPNLQFVGSLFVQSTSTSQETRKSWIVRIPTRYVSFVLVNNTSQALSGTAGDHTVTMTPIPPQIQ